MTDKYRFDNKVVVITGAGIGLGKSHATLLASLGARIVANDLGVEAVEKLIKPLFF